VGKRRKHNQLEEFVFGGPSWYPRGNRDSKNGYRVNFFFNPRWTAPLSCHIWKELPTPSPGPFFQVRCTVTATCPIQREYFDCILCSVEEENVRCVGSCGGSVIRVEVEQILGGKFGIMS
jgi:hypothetical protein